MFIKYMNIVLIHKNNSFYLENTISNISLKFSDSNLYLIGDDTNKHLAKKYNWHFHDIKKYSQKFNYYHYSVNSYSYERFCIQRWFVLKNFMENNNINYVLYFDSDNLVLDSNLLKTIHYDINYDIICLNLGKNVVVPCIITFSLKYIQNFTDSIKKFYELDKELIIDTFNNIKKNSQDKKLKNHISDMHLLADICKNKESKILEKINNFNNFNDFKIKRYTKIEILDNVICNTALNKVFNNNIIFKNNKWYVNNKVIYSLHCQGKSKKYIELICDSIKKNKDFIIKET